MLDPPGADPCDPPFVDPSPLEPAEHPLGSVGSPKGKGDGKAKTLLYICLVFHPKVTPKDDVV